MFAIPFSLPFSFLFIEKPKSNTDQGILVKSLHLNSIPLFEKTAYNHQHINSKNTRKPTILAPEVNSKS